MSTNLYQVLGINSNATPEEVRRAYRRKALDTHPDRLPQGASPAEKSAHEDLFRKVNNAYEVLSDPQNRAAYDQHGVWPPPAPAQTPFPNGPRDPFSEPFFREPFREPSFRGPRMDPFGPFVFGPRGFTDPFVLFNSIFGDFQRAFERDPFFDEPFGRRGFEPSPFGSGFLNHFPPPMSLPFDLGRGMGSSRVQMTSNGGNGGRWVSESWTSSSVNGVTHTKCVRKDSQGNEHVTYRYPDGSERRTVNGVEQSTSSPQRALMPPAPVAFPTSGPPPPYSEAVAQPHHRSHSSRHQVHYEDYPPERHHHRERHRHDHPSRDARGYHDDNQGREPQSGSSWKIFKS